MKKRSVIIPILIVMAGFFGYQKFTQSSRENKVLKQMVARLTAESRVAEVLVTNVRYDEKKQKTYTTIKFLEYDTGGRHLEPRYFTFSGNIIQFQSLVIRFDDIHVRKADALKGKSAYLFWKVFVLDGKDTQEFVITPVNKVPKGYEVARERDPFEQSLWQEFWDYALNPDTADFGGIKNAQIEAPGTMFLPGYLYTVVIEHDGGLRIDSKPISPILQGETIVN